MLPCCSNTNCLMRYTSELRLFVIIQLPMIYGDIALLYLILADPVHKPVFTKILPVLCGITSVVISVLMWNNPENPLVLQVISWIIIILNIISSDTQLKSLSSSPVLLILPILTKRLETCLSPLLLRTLPLLHVG